MTKHAHAVVAVAAMTTAGLQALGLRVPDQDARAVARGNAFVATADNPAAVYYNPAGITQLYGHQTLSSSYLVAPRASYTAPNGVGAATKDRLQLVPQFYYTYGQTNWPVAFGAGVFAPYGLSMAWPQDVAFRALAIRGSLQYLTFQPVVAWKVLPSLSLAAGPSLSYGKVDLRQGVMPIDVGDEFRFTGDDLSPGFTLGLRWQPHEKHAFGLTYRGPSQMDFEGKTFLSGPAPIPARVEDARAKMDFPQQLIVGYSFRPTPNWNLEFNADWTDWDTLGTVWLRQNSPLSLPAQAIPFNYQSSLMFEWGATRYLPGDWAISAGYIFSQNSVPTEFFTPSVVDSDRHVFSAGVGKRYERLRWDAAYQFAVAPEREIAGSTQGAAASGRYSYISHAIAISVGFAF